MSYYNQQQPPVGVPPPQGYPPQEGYAKDAYPPPGYPPQGYAQGYPPQGYPPQGGYQPQYAQPPPPQQQQSSGPSFMEGCRHFWSRLPCARGWRRGGSRRRRQHAPFGSGFRALVLELLIGALRIYPGFIVVTDLALDEPSPAEAHDWTGSAIVRLNLVLDEKLEFGGSLLLLPLGGVLLIE